MRYSGRTALVTGASAGLGKEFAEQLARGGANLVLTARREDRLEKLADELAQEHSVRATVIAEDLANPEAPARLAAAIRDRKIDVDILVNNAGYGVAGRFTSVDWRTHADFIQVLVTSVVHLTHELLPGMIERGYGRIVNVSSLAGLIPGTAGHTLYTAAKSFVIKFSESLNLENQGTGVHACAVCPGFTYTEFHDVLGNRDQVSQLPGFMWMDAETVVRQGLAATERGNAVLVNGGVNKAIAGLVKYLPHSAAMAVMARGSRATRSQG